jgi:UDP-galactopyranose mutase
MDVLIVGAGLSGATLAEQFANRGYTVTVLDKRHHVGGNVYDYTDELTGIRMNQYGAHLFHTNDEEVWTYVQRFATWIRWDHKVVSKIDSQTYVPIPVNATTVNQLCGANLKTEEEMATWLAANQVSPPVADCPSNSEEMALSRVGKDLYEKLFLPYTVKQWNKHPRELDPSVLARIPVRSNFDDRYFEDKYQALPRDGYTAVVQAMLTHPAITVHLNTSYDPTLHRPTKFLFYTGPIDAYFAHLHLPTLEYRSIDFVKEYKLCEGTILPTSVVNDPSPATPYTRTVEYKHFLHQHSPYTVLVHEKTTDEGEPYYPVPTSENQRIYSLYQAAAAASATTADGAQIHFVGRLANYKYFNMDAAIRNAFTVVAELLRS